jgi:hypothetical protein
MSIDFTRLPRFSPVVDNDDVSLFMALFEDAARLSVGHRVEDDGKVVVVGVQLARRHVQLQSLVVDEPLDALDLHAELAALVRAPIDDADLLFRIDDDAVADIEAFAARRSFLGFCSGLAACCAGFAGSAADGTEASSGT